MANVPFSRLYDQVLPYIPGAELPIVDVQIRKALREFMKRTTLIRETFVFPTVDGSSTYALTPAFGQVSSVLHVSIDNNGTDRELPVRPEELRYANADESTPNSWWTTVPGMLTLYPTPDAAYSVSIIAVVTLKQDDTTFPEELATNYAEVIAAGAISALMAMPGKPWTSSANSQAAGRAFSDGIKTIRGGLRDGGQPNQSTFRGIARFGA